MLSRRHFFLGLSIAVAAVAARLGFKQQASGDAMISIALVADAHHSTADSGTKNCLRARELLGHFKTYCNGQSLDRVVNLGDIIEEVSAGVDETLIAQLVSDFAGFSATVQHLPGNHDIRNKNVAYWEAQFSKSFSSRSEDVNGFHLVYFCPVAGTGPYTYTSEELAWLTADLAGTSLPTIIFTHVPIRASSLKGNGYFDTGGNGEWTNGDAVHAILKNSKTILCVSGHTHWNAWHMEDDIYYVTLPSLTETRRTSPSPSNSSALLEIDDKNISLRVRGRDSIAYKMRRRVGTTVWT